MSLWNCRDNFFELCHVHFLILLKYQEVAKRRSLDTSIDAKYLEAVKEFLAEKASLGVEDGTTWQKICVAFRQFLRNMGLNIAYSDNDIQELFRQSLRAVQNKTAGSVGNLGSNGARFMLNRKPESIEDFINMPAHKQPPKIKFTNINELYDIYKLNID